MSSNHPDTRIDYSEFVLLLSSLLILGGIGAQAFYIGDELGVFESTSAILFLIGIALFGLGAMLRLPFVRKVISRD